MVTSVLVVNRRTFDDRLKGTMTSKKLFSVCFLSRKFFFNSIVYELLITQGEERESEDRFLRHLAFLHSLLDCEFLCIYKKLIKDISCSTERRVPLLEQLICMISKFVHRLFKRNRKRRAR